MPTVARGTVEFIADDSKLNKAASRIESRMQKVGAAMNKVGVAAKRIGVITGAAFAGAVVVGARFEQSMARVKAISGATGDEFETLEAKAKKLGSTTEFTASQAAAAMASFALSGFKVNEILEVMSPTLDLASAAQVDLGTAADITSKVLRGMRIPVSETTKVMDILTKAFTTANTDIVQLGEAMKFVGPVAASAGKGLEETVAALQVLSDAGIQASMAGTGLRKILIELQGARADKAFRKLGVEIRGVDGKLKPLPDLIDEMSRAMEGLDPLKRAALIGLFGQRAGPALEVLLAKGGRALRKYQRALEDAGGTAKKIADIQRDTLKGSFDRVRSAAEGVAIAFKEIVGPAVREFLNSVADMLGKLQKWIKGNQELTKSLTAIAAAVLSLLVVLPKMIALMGFLGGTQIISGIGKAAAAMKGFSLTASVTATRAGPLVGAIVLVGAAFFALGQALSPANRELKEANKQFEKMIKFDKELAELGKERGTLEKRATVLKERLATLDKSSVEFAEDSIELNQVQIKQEEQRRKLLTLSLATTKTDGATREAVLGIITKSLGITIDLERSQEGLVRQLQVAEFIETATGELVKKRRMDRERETAQMKLQATINEKIADIEIEALKEENEFAARRLEIERDIRKEREALLKLQEKAVGKAPSKDLAKPSDDPFKKLEDIEVRTEGLVKPFADAFKKLDDIQKRRLRNVERDRKREIFDFVAGEKEKAIAAISEDKKRLLSFAKTEEEKNLINRAFDKKLKGIKEGEVRAPEFIGLQEFFRKVSTAGAVVETPQAQANKILGLIEAAEKQQVGLLGSLAGSAANIERIVEKKTFGGAVVSGPG